MKITKDMIKENTVFHCDTEEKAIEFCKKLDELGYMWTSGSSYLSHNNYNSYKEDTYYCPYEGEYGKVSCYRNYKIIEYELDKDVKFTMDDIKDGYLIETRDGKRYLCCNDDNDKKIFAGYGDFITTICYRLDLIYKDFGNGDFSKFDIVKVYGRSGEFACLLSLKTDNRKLLWERKEEIIEMTMEEICKELGKNVKIVK